MTNYKLIPDHIAIIKNFEGCKLYAYRDSVGVPTIGYGHTKGVKMGMAITQKQAEKFLKEDLAAFEKHVNALGVCKTQHQFAALVSFAFNCGTANLDKSTLLKKIRANAPTEEIKKEFKRWVHAGGKVLPGLVRRRAYEAMIWDAQ